METSDWLLENFNHFKVSGFLGQHSKKGITFYERSLTTEPEIGVKNCVHCCLRPPVLLERCEILDMAHSLSIKGAE